jgi:hypothetical protein
MKRWTGGSRTVPSSRYLDALRPQRPPKRELRLVLSGGSEAELILGRSLFYVIDDYGFDRCFACLQPGRNGREEIAEVWLMVLYPSISLLPGEFFPTLLAETANLAAFGRVVPSKTPMRLPTYIVGSNLLDGLPCCLSQLVD